MCVYTSKHSLDEAALPPHKFIPLKDPMVEGESKKRVVKEMDVVPLLDYGDPPSNDILIPLLSLFPSPHQRLTRGKRFVISAILRSHDRVRI